MNSKPTLVLMVGLPRSGKSTWLDGVVVPIVCPDEIRKVLGCYPFDAARETEVWYIAHVMVKALFGAGARRVYLDACSITTQRRAEWSSPDWDLEYQIITTPSHVCLRRAIESGQDYLVPVIDRMDAAADWKVEIEQPDFAIPFSLDGRRIL